MKILIISRYFNPSQKIGAIRPTKIAKYLFNLGHDISIIIYDDTKKGFYLIENIDSTDFENTFSLIKKEKPNSKNNIKRKHSFIYDKIYPYYSLIHDLRDYYAFKKNLKILKSYDAVFSTFSTHSSHLIARKYKVKFKNTVWISDFRDLPNQEGTPYFIKLYNKFFLRKICNLANLITVVSDGMANDKQISKYQNKILKLSNGYDKSDLHIKCKTNFEFELNNKINFTYTGQLYNGKRDFSPLFKILSEIIDENPTFNNKFRVNYAGSDFMYILMNARKYNLESILVNWGSISREHSLKLQEISDFLLISTWNTKREKGIVTGKLYEYMLSNKPVLGFVSGEVKNSEIKKIISKTRIGYTFEEADFLLSHTEMKKFILDTIKKPNNHLKNLNTLEIKSYDYEYIAKRLEEEIMDYYESVYK